MEIRIDGSKAAGLYEAAAKDLSKKENNRASGEKFDKISFSTEGQKYSEASRAAASVKTVLSREMAAERINELRDAVKNGTYSVPSIDIARAMLGVSDD